MSIATLEPYLKDARVRAFLDTISQAEGTTKHGYFTLVGNTRIAALAQHPNKLVRLSPTLASTAAGRYQFLKRTWDGLQSSLRLQDFGPRSQDLGAIELLRQCGALRHILNNEFASAVLAARRIWASFPGAGYGQGERSLAYMQTAYNTAIKTPGIVSGGGGGVKFGGVGIGIIALAVVGLLLVSK